MTCASDSESSLKGRRVLVVEDEPLLAMELVDELEAVGASSLGPVATVTEALSFIQANQAIDAALINVQLRGELSFAVADYLSCRKVPFLFVTGNDRFIRKHYPDVPVHPKPSDMPTLIKALRLLLADPGAAAIADVSGRS